MKYTEDLQHQLYKAGFRVGISKPYRGSFELTCTRGRDDIELVIVVGVHSQRILRAHVSSPTIGSVTERKNIPEFLTTVKCACSECVAALKKWNNQ